MKVELDKETVKTIKAIIKQYEENYETLDTDELNGIASDCVDILQSIIASKTRS